MAVTAEAAPFALNCLVSGWPIAERALQLLRARHPAARITMSPDDLGGGSEATRSVALHAGGRITAFSAAGDVNDGQVVVAVGAADGSVRIQAMAASSEPVRRVLHRGRITALDVAAGGAMVISGGQDGAVRIWSPATRGHQRVLASHDGWVNAVQARQGIVFSLGDDGRLRRTSIEARPPAAAESAYPISVGWATSTALAVSEDAGLVAIGGTDGRVLLWDGVTGMPRGDLSVGTAIVALALSPAAKLLAVAGEDGSVHAYELPKHKLLARLLAPTGQPNCLAVGPSSEIATGEDSGRVRLWRTGSRGGLGDQGIVLGRHRDAVGGVAVTGSGQLISASESGLVRAWRGAGAGRRQHEVEAP